MNLNEAKFNIKSKKIANYYFFIVAYIYIYIWKQKNFITLKNY